MRLEKTRNLSRRVRNTSLTRNKARRVPYRGVAANHLWLTTRAAAVNLVRLTNLGVTHNNGAFTL